MLQGNFLFHIALKKIINKIENNEDNGYLHSIKSNKKIPPETIVLDFTIINRKHISIDFKRKYAEIVLGKFINIHDDEVFRNKEDYPNISTD